MPKHNKIKSFLPSSRFVIVIITLALVVGIVVGIRAVIKSYQKRQFVAKTGIEAQVKIGELLSADTDGDGLLDWEEPLWSMDPKNPDTNGDGVSDGVDATNQKTALGGSDTENSRENLNETQKFSRDLFATISALSQSGALTEESIVNLAATLGDQITTKNIPDQFEDTNLKVIPASKENAEEYHAKFSAIIEKYSPEKIGGEMEVMIQMFDKDDANLALELAVIADDYRSFAREIMALSVPADIAIKHLALANAADKIGVSLYDVKNVFDNPIVSLGGFISYTKEAENFIKTLEELHLYFKKNGIIRQ